MPLRSDHLAVPLDEELVRLGDKQGLGGAAGGLGQHQPHILLIDTGEVIEIAVDRKGVHILIVALDGSKAGMEERNGVFPQLV